TQDLAQVPCFVRTERHVLVVRTKGARWRIESAARHKSRIGIPACLLIKTIRADCIAQKVSGGDHNTAVVSSGSGRRACPRSLSQCLLCNVRDRQECLSYRVIAIHSPSCAVSIGSLTPHSRSRSFIASACEFRIPERIKCPQVTER